MKLNKNIWNNLKLTEVLKEGGIAIMPTDTVYGIVGRAENPYTVERIYKARTRASEKPCIILIGSIDEIKNFSVNISEEQERALKTYWNIDPVGTNPSPVSIILDCAENRFEYLHRGTKTLAFRLPTHQDLRDFLMKTGPLIAPSANTEGSPVAEDIEEAKKYFGDLVDLYIDGKKIAGKVSKIIRVYADGAMVTIRE